jgi:hypothetical protein
MDNDLHNHCHENSISHVVYNFEEEFWKKQGTSSEYM